MSQELDLEALRKIAEAEPTHKWGDWDFEEDDWDGHAVFISDNGPGVSYVAEKITQGEDDGESTARFIATFDPPTVLALLSRLEQAEQAVDRKQSAVDTLARIIEMQQDAVILATDSQDLIGEDGDGDWDAVWDRVRELGEGKRKAERAVARVREALTEVQGRGERISEMPNTGSIRSQERAARGTGYLEATRLAFRALDGDGRG